MKLKVWPRKKNCLFPSDRVSKKISSGRPQKICFFILFSYHNCTILLFFLFGFYTLRLFVCFNFIFNINAQIAQYLIVLAFEVRMIYVHFSFFLWLLLVPFIHVKERKMKNWKKVLAKKPKDEWSSHVAGKRMFLNIGIEEQQNYYEQWSKESVSELRIKIT